MAELLWLKFSGKDQYAHSCRLGKSYAVFAACYKAGHLSSPVNVEIRSSKSSPLVPRWCVIDVSQCKRSIDCFELRGLRTTIVNCVMFTFLKILIVVLLALVLIDWLHAQDAKRWNNIPNNVPAGWASLSSSIKIRSAAANESPKGTSPLLEETFLPGDIEYADPKGNVRIYFPIVTAVLLALVLTLIFRFWGKGF